MGWTCCDSRQISLLGVFVLVLTLPLERNWAAEQFYGANLAQSTWTLVRGADYCELRHDIPRYGRAVFKKASASALQFSLHVMQPPIDDGYAHLIAIPPPWEHDTRERDLGRVTITRGTTPIVWERDQALRLFYELENGMFSYLKYQDWGDGRDAVTVALSPVRFREVLPEFLECNRSRASRRHGLEIALELLVYFDTDSSTLNQADIPKLKDIATRFISESSRFDSIVITGHADRRGASGYNHGLSLRRAAVVADVLRQQGVPSNTLDIRYFGETWPLENGDNELAWSKNRRVSVWLTAKSKGTSW